MKRAIGPVRDASPGVLWSCRVYRGMEVCAVRGHASHEGLSVGYRVLYRVKHMGLSVFGPAELGEGEDPRRRLERERETKVLAARRKRLGK